MNRKSLAPLLGFLLLTAMTIGCGEDTSSSSSAPPPEVDGSPSESEEEADGYAAQAQEDLENTIDEERYAAAQTTALDLADHPFRVVDQLAFPFADENGACVGFDLDGVVSDSKESDACGWEDYVSPEGVAGIDNNLAVLTPLFDSVGLGQAFLYLQDSIESSGFFLLFEVQGVDPELQDGPIDLVFHVGGGEGLIGTDGSLVAEQTLCIQNDSPALPADSSWVEDGWIHARFTELVMPFVLFERVYEFRFLDARLKGKLNADGRVTNGIVGGTITLENLLELAENGGQNQGGLFETVQGILKPMGDMPTENGACTGLSSAFEFSSAPVYVYPDSQECDRCGNGTCENFESCETCLVDCCPTCGDGICDFFPPTETVITLDESGFSPSTVDVLVGDTIRFENTQTSAVHLVCDGLMDIVLLDESSTHETVPLGSGAFSCRLLEEDGIYATIDVEDNTSETCQSCPSDCLEGC